VEVIIQRDYQQMSKVAARIVAEVLNTKPNAVLGMATGSTPLGLYQELVRLHKEEQLDFARVTTFNLDEYVGLTANHPQSYHYFMHEHFFQHVNIPRQNINIPSGTTSNYPAFCKWYEQRITECGGIDLQILGIGSDGHIAFNEPTSSLSSRTRLKTLSKQTIDDNARFFERRDSVPVYAITMGVGTILDARKLVLVASLDNILRPVLIKKGADLPLLLIFAGVIGGLFAFGLLGLFVGPVLLAVAYTLLDAWVEEAPDANVVTATTAQRPVHSPPADAENG